MGNVVRQLLGSILTSVHFPPGVSVFPVPVWEHFLAPLNTSQTMPDTITELANKVAPWPSDAVRLWEYLETRSPSHIS